MDVMEAENQNKNAINALKAQLNRVKSENRDESYHRNYTNIESAK